MSREERRIYNKVVESIMETTGLKIIQNEDYLGQVKVINKNDEDPIIDYNTDGYNLVYCLERLARTIMESILL